MMTCVEKALPRTCRVTSPSWDGWHQERVGSRKRASQVIDLLGRKLASAQFPPAALATMRRLASEAIACAGPPGWRLLRYRVVGRHVEMLIEGPEHNLIRLALLRDGYAEWQRWGSQDGQPRLKECRLIH